MPVMVKINVTDILIVIFAGLLVLLCVGDPDLIDAIVNRIKECE